MTASTGIRKVVRLSAKDVPEIVDVFCESFLFHTQLHVNMIGVRSAWQGRGLGRVLLDWVGNMSQEGASRGISLNTEVENNIFFYERLGYYIVGEPFRSGTENVEFF